MKKKNIAAKAKLGQHTKITIIPGKGVSQAINYLLEDRDELEWLVARLRRQVALLIGDEVHRREREGLDPLDDTDRRMMADAEIRQTLTADEVLDPLAFQHVGAERSEPVVRDGAGLEIAEVVRRVVHELHRPHATLVRFLESLEGVLADRLQHPEARLAPRVRRT